MKKTIILFSVCLFALTYTQTAQAQTKEETIAWIKEKFEKYTLLGTGKKIENVNVTPCEIVITRTWSDGASYFRVVETIPTTAKIIDPLRDHTSLVFDVDALEGKVYKASSKNGDYRFLHTTYNSFYMLEIRESNLLIRMKKAIEHLATFCDKKEPF